MLANLVAYHFRVMYRNMALGLAWSLVRPIVLVTVLSIVWLVFFSAPRYFPAFVLVCLVPFQFTSQCVQESTRSVVANAAIVKKLPFPRSLLPLAILFTHLIHFIIQSPLIALALMLFQPSAYRWSYTAWLVPLLLLHVLLTGAVGLLVAALNVLYRDVQYIVESLLVVLFWCCPILYDAGVRLQTAHPMFRFFYYLNPLAGILECYRKVLFFGLPPDFSVLLSAVTVTLVIVLVAVVVFCRYEASFADLL